MTVHRLSATKISKDNKVITAKGRFTFTVGMLLEIMNYE
jgi:hypothetical protein